MLVVSVRIYLLIYVDDILVTGSDPSRIATLISNLGHQFSMKDLGPSNYLLGMEIVCTPSSLSLTQTKYVVNLLKRVNMHEAKLVPTLAVSGRHLSLSDGDPLPDPTEYHSTVGALQCLTLTRPDIAFAIDQVVLSLSVCTLMPIIRGILTIVAPLVVLVFTWVLTQSHGVLRSNVAFLTRVLRPNIANLPYTAATLSWLRALFLDLHLPVPCPKLWCDNISALSVASNPVFHSHTRHVEVNYHFIREKVVRNESLVTYC
ncbi:unnamed protein product [Prunus armeniaca]